MEETKTINLAYRALSDIKYDFYKFPDGETHIKFAEELDRKQDYTVICRITNSEDLWILMQVGHILNTVKVVWDLKILYLMSMRMDRIITFRESFTLELVADAINRMEPRTVYIFHPHSLRTMLEIKNSQYLDNLLPTVVHLEELFYNPWIGEGHTAICYPDKGAYDRYTLDHGFRYRDAGNKPGVIVLKKVRDPETGQIKSIDFDEIKDVSEAVQPKRITVLDDLCDAGGTFVKAAKLLRKRFPHSELFIFVRHMVNPLGIENLAKAYDSVYFTNSYSDFHDVNIPQNVFMYDVFSDMKD